MDAPLLGAFIVPNAPVQDVELTRFEVELGELERHVGLRFHSQLDRSRTGRLCLVQGCRLREYKEFQEFFWARRLSSPWNIRSLERDWAEAQRKGAASPTLEQLYQTKRKELMEQQQLRADKQPQVEQQLTALQPQKVADKRTAEEESDGDTRRRMVSSGGTTAEAVAAGG